MNKHISYILLFLISWMAQAQDLPKVGAIADTTAIRAGEQVRLQVRVQADTLSFVDFPEMSELGDMEVVKTDAVDTAKIKPYRELVKNYYLTQWDTGKYVVAPVSVKIQDSIFKTDSLYVKVLPVKIDTTKQGLYDFKPLVNIEGEDNAPANNKPSFWWLLLLLLLPLGYFIYKRRKAYIESHKALTPYEKALAALTQLQKDKLWLKGKVDIHYLHLTDLMKDFLESELHVNVKEKISSDILQVLRKYRFEDGTYITPDLIDRLKETFNRADLAKFAKLEPNPSDIDVDFNNIKDLIDSTHATIQKIADAKADEIAAKEAAKKKKRRIALIVTGSILLLIALLLGGAYYYVKKSGLAENLQENMAKPEWVYSEYGAKPSLGVTTPHILHNFDLSQFLDTLPENKKKIFSEVSFYVDENLVKKYVLLEGNMSLNTDIKDEMQFDKVLMVGMLQNIQARDVNLQEAEEGDAKRYFGTFKKDIPVIGNNLNIAFDSRFFKIKNGVRMVIGFYLEGNKKNKDLVERVLNSASLNAADE